VAGILWVLTVCNVFKSTSLVAISLSSTRMKTMSTSQVIM